ncbi:MAG TPA: TetR/AcrR family transcriptional regulator [Gammaproteobacteria bacterium]|nr:TetR/AcrR family transcriptional regulator [Gammaproteobacteria bacterium]
MNAASEEGLSAKQTDILGAAWQVFLRESYAMASMESIAQEAGVSKQTVYNHFGSKEDLFRAIIERRCERLSAAFGEEFRYHGDEPGRLLTVFGERFLEIMLSKETMELHRLLQAESRRHPRLARIFYEYGADRTARQLADYLAEQDTKGRLRIRDARLAAEQFITMLPGHLRLRHLLGTAPPPTAAERSRYIASAVRLFLDGVRPR